MQSISFGTVERNDAWAVMWEGYQLERISTPLSLRYSDGTTLQLEDVFSRVIDILFHSLGSLSSALSAAGWLLRNTDEGIPVSAITTLSEAFGVGGFTISITWSGILIQWAEFNTGSSIAFLVDEWVTPDLWNNSDNLELKLGWGLLTLKSLWPPLVFR